jgi:hypothetical protein
MQPLCAKAESEWRFQPRKLSGLLQARSEMRLWRNTILKRLSNHGRCEGLEAGTPNAQLTDILA